MNHDVEFYPYEERDVFAVHIHPEFYAGTLYNDIAVLRLTQPIDPVRSPHIAPACLPDPHYDYTGSRCWTTGWGKDAFGEYGKYQNILKVCFSIMFNVISFPNFLLTSPALVSISFPGVFLTSPNLV